MNDAHHNGIEVRWSRPGLDRVRVGRGRVVGLEKDGSLRIIDSLGHTRSIQTAHVERRVTVKGRRKMSWARWSESDTNEASRGTMALTEGEALGEVT